MPNSSQLGLYIHWPFCLSKCPYCDFNSHVSSDIDEEAWHKALITELHHMAELSQRSAYGRRPLSSVFFGGGTPSLMPTKIMSSLITEAEKLFGFMADIEITAEANPTSVETAKLQGFQQAGVNRVSLGIQSLDDTALSFLGRGHSANEAIKALELSRELFDRVSIDLIYGLKDQSVADWEDQLSKALSFDLDHLSLYQLTIEPGTQFYSRARKGEVLNLDDDAMADLYLITETQTAAHGLFNYEVSNYARSGAQSRHNLLYWRCQDWLGIGPGAHGRLTERNDRRETITRRSPQGWLTQIQDKGHGISQSVIDNQDAICEEILMMGLRLSEGVPLSRLSQLAGMTDWPFTRQQIEPLISEGWLSLENDQLIANFEGRLRLNYMLQALLAS